MRRTSPPRSRAQPSAREYLAALQALHAIGEGCPSPVEFAQRGVTLLPRLVPSEITTLSVCDLASGRRRVLSQPREALPASALDAFDRHFFEHPLVRHHATTPGGGAHRISDSLSSKAFHATPLYADYYLAVGLDHALALPMYLNGNVLVSFVFNRRTADFADRERALLESIRAPLADLFRSSMMLACMRAALKVAGPGQDAAAARDGAPGNAYAADRMAGLTPREREILGWVSAGKSNAQIAEIVGASARTVAKHLEHVYAKLGVESRTAAAMRAVGGRTRGG